MQDSFESTMWKMRTKHRFQDRLFLKEEVDPNDFCAGFVSDLNDVPVQEK